MNKNDISTTDRLNIDDALDAKDINILLGNKNLNCIQTDKPLKENTLTRLNELFFSKRTDVEFRLWGYNRTICDLSSLTYLSNVEILSADCLFDVINEKYISNISKLKKLSFGAYRHTNFDFLNDISSTIESLSLHPTFSKKPKLDMLNRFVFLKRLYLDSQQSGIDVISCLKQLEDLTLRSISTDTIDYINGHDKLWSLDIKLGGIKSFKAIESLNIKYLELWKVNGLKSIDFISYLAKLQNIFLQDLTNIKYMPELLNNKALTRITIQNLKQMRSLEAIKNAPSLNEFCFIMAMNHVPSDFAPIFENIKIEKVLITSNKKTNEYVDKMMKENNIERYKFSKYEYK